MRRKDEKPGVCILRTAGTNCDKETYFAFLKAQGAPELVHINELINKQKLLEDYQILVIPGGFSYGDDLGAGKILANELKFKLIEDIVKFVREGKLILGICNGFQVLVKSGLLSVNTQLKQDISLIINDSGKFEDRWVYLKSQGPETKNRKCVWTQGLPEIIYLPVAHGEGKFIAQDKQALDKLRKNQQVVFRYCDEKGNFSGYPRNPNGSEDNIAGICDETGRILGMMPHPERHIDIAQHPRASEFSRRQEGDGLQIFRNGIEYIKKNL